MAIIYKYPLAFGVWVTVRNGDVVHFGADANDKLCAWICHRGDDHSTTDLAIVGTGAEFDDMTIVHSSYVDPQGYVWHLIEDWSPDA